MAIPPDADKMLERLGAEVVYSEKGLLLPMTVEQIQLTDDHVMVRLDRIRRYPYVFLWSDCQPWQRDSFWVVSAWKCFTRSDSLWGYTDICPWIINFNKQAILSLIDLCEKGRHLDIPTLYRLAQRITDNPQPAEALIAQYEQSVRVGERPAPPAPGKANA